MVSCALPLLVATSMGIAPGGSGQGPQCPMRPAWSTFRAARSGFVEIGGGPSREACEVPAAGDWTVVRTSSFALFVHPDGPGGSGRYWVITVGVAPSDQPEPRRGFCLETTTVGWRTLQRFRGVGLPWVEDVDQDGQPELVIWGSFPLSDEASLAEYGLVAWVYDADSSGAFAIDWSASRRLARELASAYAQPLEQGGPGLQPLRGTAARALEAFASGACTPARPARLRRRVPSSR